MKFSSEMTGYLKDEAPQSVEYKSSEPSCGLLDLRILATTDLHGHLRGYDYGSGKEAFNSGLSRVATLIEQAREERQNTLLFDNGDFLQGSQLVDFWGRERQWAPDDVHPMISAMNALRYDGGTLGNHDFNFGLDYLGRVLRDARFPIVLSNLSATDSSLPNVLPWTILDKTFRDRSGTEQKLSVGIVGFVPPQVMKWDGSFLSGRAESCDIIEAAMRTVPLMKAAGAEIIVALAHTGIDLTSVTSGRTGTENVAVPLAGIPEIDVIICGHIHLTFPDPHIRITSDVIDPVQGTLNGTPAVMPGHRGSHLGIVDISLRRDSHGQWRPVRSRSTLRPVARVTSELTIEPIAGEHPDIVSVSSEAHLEVTRKLAHPVGQIDAPLQSFFCNGCPGCHN